MGRDEEGSGRESDDSLQPLEHRPNTPAPFAFKPPTPETHEDSMQTPVPTPAGLARELWELCERFAVVAEQAERISTEDMWAEINGAFSAMSLHPNAGSDRAPAALAWRKRMENWIADQLQQKRRAQLDDLYVSRSTTPQPPPPPLDFAADPVAFSLQPHQTSSAMQQGRGNMFSPVHTSSLDASSHSPFTSSHSPSNSLDSPQLVSGSYPNAPSPFLSPAQYGNTNAPNIFFQPAMMATNALPSINFHGFDTQGNANGSVSGQSDFGDLEMDHRWTSALIDFAAIQQQGQQQQLEHHQMQQQNMAASVAAFAAATNPDIHRPAPILPRLVTTDLSPPNQQGFVESPTISLDRPPTPIPGSKLDDKHSRTRSLSASGPATPARSHHRRLSSGSGSPRYHPFQTSPRNSLSDASLLGPEAADAALLNPSSLMSDLALTSPSSPASSAGGGSRRRSRSTEPKTRTTRSLAYDENAVFLKNEQHVFVLHTQTRYKPEITEQDVIEIELDPESPMNDPSSLLCQVVRSDLPYSKETLLEECEREAEYAFMSTRAGLTTRWTVKYSLDRSTDEPSPRTVIEPAQPVLNPPPVTPTYTFVHFVPGTIVVNPTYPMGSSKWWRVQECDVKHENCPGDGSWTARWDEEGEERRPSRVVQHYATCALRKKDGDFFALGKLARAVRTTKKRSEVLRTH